MAERVHQLEVEARNDSLHGKCKQSGRYNVTESSHSVSYRCWVNESILVGPSKHTETFDELTTLQFCLGFVKNIIDTLDSLTHQFMMLEFYELLKLIEATSWEIAKGAYISIMHAIEEGELSWHDRASLMQR